MNDYISVTVDTDSEGAELIAALFFDFLAEGVEIIDPNDIKDVISSGNFWDYIDDNLKIESDVVKVIGFFNENTDFDALISELNAYECKQSKPVIAKQENEDWSKVWRTHYKTKKIGRLVIKPEWEEYEPKDDEAVFVIEPGQAFGTGEHESTKMCLELAQELDFNGKTVLDIGCGSGILGISSVLLGAKSATLTDLDESAVKVARENAVKNNVDTKATILCADLSNTECKFDVVFANLTADILIRLSGSVINNMNDDTILIVSGIIDERKDDVLQAFAKVNLTVIRERAENDWRAYALKIKK